MQPCQDRILPLLEKQASVIEPTEANLRDVSLCVCFASGWAFMDDPANKCTRVDAPDKRAYMNVGNSDYDGLAISLLKRGMMPRYATDMNVIHRLWTSLFTDLSINTVMLPLHERVYVTFAIFDQPYRDAFGRPTYAKGIAPAVHPALAWSLAFLKLRMEHPING